MARHGERKVPEGGSPAAVVRARCCLSCALLAKITKALWSGAWNRLFVVAPTFVFVLQRLCLKLMFDTPLYLFLSVCVCVSWWLSW